MPDWSAWLGTPTKKMPNRDPEAGEILKAGFDIPKGDPRLKGGVNYGNLSQGERDQLDQYRKKNGS
jgi:hypothetical protein